jgi:hypothetical protein
MAVPKKTAKPAGGTAKKGGDKPAGGRVTNQGAGKAGPGKAPKTGGAKKKG